MRQLWRSTLEILPEIEEMSRNHSKRIQALAGYLRYKSDQFFLKVAKYNSEEMYKDCEGFNMFFDNNLNQLNMMLTQKLSHTNLNKN